MSPAAGRSGKRQFRARSARNLARSLPVAASQSTTSSKSQTANVVRSGDAAAFNPMADGTGRRRISLPVAASHHRTVSKSTDTIVFPSGKKLAISMAPPWRKRIVPMRATAPSGSGSPKRSVGAPGAGREGLQRHRQTYRGQPVANLHGLSSDARPTLTNLFARPAANPASGAPLPVRLPSLQPLQPPPSPPASGSFPARPARSASTSRDAGVSASSKTSIARTSRGSGG